ncbi:MAG: hypothetical protein ACRYF0_12250 [Janthinobacterium lividum]
MEYLFGLVFTLFKIAIQASFYATAARWLAQLADARQLDNALVRASRQKRQFWRRGFVVAYAALLLFSCTYWGDHGLGDSARIPLGHGEEMSEINGTETYFTAKAPFTVADMDGAQEITKFQVADEVLCGHAEQTSYFSYNLVTKEHHVFADSIEYNAYAVAHGLPASGELQPFWKHYRRYWGGWRFWLLA